MARLSINRIEAATDSIDAVFQNSPQYVCPGLSAIFGCSVVLKVETLNQQQNIDQGAKSQSLRIICIVGWFFRFQGRLTLGILSQGSEVAV